RLSQTGHMVSVRTDVSRLKQAEQQIKRQAERDPLTGLYNRRVLQGRLARTLHAKEPTDRSSSALAIVDLDGFKDINDAYGHDTGDAYLVAIAERLRLAVRKTDLVARLGDDEFAILAGNVSSPRDAERLASKLLASLREPMRVLGRLFVPSASVGIALLPRDGRTP